MSETPGRFSGGGQGRGLLIGAGGVRPSPILRCDHGRIRIQAGSHKAASWIMQDKEANLVTSGLSGHRSADGTTLELCIYRLEHKSDWTLEVVLADGTSVVWDETFPSDFAADAEFQRTLKEDGVSALVGNVIQFPRH